MRNGTGTGVLSEELHELRSVIREFMEREIAPIDTRLEHDAYRLDPADLERVQRVARASGLWCLSTPEEYGGAGMSLLARCVVAEEAAKCKMGAYVPASGAFGWDPPGVMFTAGTPEQIERFAIPAIARGDRKTYVAISEPGGGADPARSIRTTAVQQADGSFVINGTKLWITGPDESLWGLVFARTITVDGVAAGISCFIVPTDTPGFSTSPIPVIRSWAPCEISLVDCRVPAENVLGELGAGFDVAQSWLVHARVPYAAGVIGVAQAALDIAVEYVRERETFGARLATRQSIQWMVADSEVELRAARHLVYEAAALADAGRPFKTEASMCKLYATEAAGRVVDRAIQMMGALGVSREFPLERWYRELRIKRIGEGPSEVHRMVIARSVLGRAEGERAR